MRPTFEVVTLALVMCVGRPAPALAAWPRDPGVNLPVCSAPDNQNSPAIVSDGAGGSIVAWQDGRDGDNDIYVQHVLASGVVDPLWPVDGRPLCTVPGSQLSPAIVSDGSGGAIVTWYDFRGGANSDIYAQHVLASGALDPAWPADGRALTTAAGDQLAPQAVSDGTGGAIVCWYDVRGGTHADIYAQRVTSAGALAPAWPVDGRVLCSATGDQQNPRIITDGSGGAIVAWNDFRGGGTSDIYAQRVLAGGALGPGWPSNGRAICTAPSDQSSAAIAPDGAGGGIVAWQDFRDGVAFDIYAQHLLGSGAVDAGWPANGQVLCGAPGLQQLPAIVSDDAGGAVVVWQDRRAVVGFDIHAQHVLASGAVDPGWPADGLPLCTATGSQQFPNAVSDGTGGAVVVWRDARAGSGLFDIYAQRVLVSGAVDAAFPVDGRALCTAPDAQDQPVAQADGAGGVIVAWADRRSGSYDIQAQRIGRFGYLGTPEPVITSVRDVPGDGGRVVRVSWSASYLDTDGDPNLAAYDIWRSVPATPLASGATRAGAPAFTWEYLATQNATGLPGASYLAATRTDSSGLGNPRTSFMIVARNAAGSLSWPSPPDSGYSVNNLAPENLDLLGSRPNPVKSTATIHFTLPRPTSISLTIYDAAGRRIRALAQGAWPAGDHVLPWDLRDDAGRGVPSGLYLLRLVAEGRALTRRMVISR